ncbi:MAG: hypothetical protein NTV51_15970, partial [Verrucomicrobia bacterium]|nr:hypothetical protein [Verrucomicrobiota bacterium]
ARAMALAREAAEAAAAKDNAGYLAKMEAAVALRPDFPRMLVNLAAAQLANDRPDEAIATLGRLAALGAHSPVEKSADFAALRDQPEFKAVVKKIAANLYPIGRGEIEFSVPDMTGAIEGLAWREKTGEFFLGDAHNRCVWVRTGEKQDVKVRRFTPEGEELWGVLGLAVDEEHGVLWAATSAVPAMSGFTQAQDGTAGLAEIDLVTGAVRRVVPVVRKDGDQYSHVLGDLALGPDGSVYLPDSGGPTIWRLAPGGTALEAWAGSAEFLSLQGAAVAPEASALFVADHANGLLRVDLTTRAVRRLDPPENTTLIGIDALVRAPTGDLIAVQNGLRPNRVLRITIDASGESITGVTVLESAHLTMAAPALGCIATDGAFFFVGNSGWARFDEAGAPATAPRPVPIFKTKL